MKMKTLDYAPSTLLAGVSPMTQQSLLDATHTQPPASLAAIAALEKQLAQLQCTQASLSQQLAPLQRQETTGDSRLQTYGRTPLAGNHRTHRCPGARRNPLAAADHYGMH